VILRILAQESSDSELRLKDMKERSSESEIGIWEGLRGLNMNLESVWVLFGNIECWEMFCVKR
jgi:hypothetical protein